jgi:hypothetical protein
MEPTTDNNIGPAAALMAALAKAQGEFKPIEKNREVEIIMKSGGKYRFRYADLEEIIAKTRPALSANGLSMIQTIEHSQAGQLLTCKLMHAGGGIITSELPIPSAREFGGDPKSFGALISYHRRYMVTSMLGVAADDDLDEDGQEMGEQPARTASKPPVQQPQRRERPAGDTASPAPATGDTTPATQGELAYITKKIEAKGWTRAQAYEAAGLAYAEGAAMTKAEFAAIKAVVA